MKLSHPIGALIALTCYPALATAQSSEVVTKLTLADPDDATLFGQAVAVSGDRLLAGASSTSVNPGGLALMFRRVAGEWSEEQVLVPTGSQFAGTTVALCGDVAALRGRTDDAARESRVWVFERNGAAWVQVAELTSGSAREDAFGFGLACDGERILAGAPRQCYGDLSGPGRAYVFVRGTSGWELEAELAGDDDPNGFGASVSLDDNTALVGAPRCGSESGSAFVFRRAGGSWALEQEIFADPGIARDEFGRKVALVDETAVVCADSGAFAFAFTGGAWVQESQLLFGEQDSCSASGNIAVVGHSGGSLGASGTARVFTRSGASWLPRARVFAIEPAYFQIFGLAVSNDGDRVVVGAPRDGPMASGAVYVFERPVGVFHCTSLANSTGDPAVLVARGSPSLQADDLDLLATPVPDTPGLYFAGPTPIQAPFGPGYRCVGGTVKRLGIVFGSGATSRTRLDLGSGTFGAGTTWYFQLWFRDTLSGVDSFNTSDSVAITFVP